MVRARAYVVRGKKGFVTGPRWPDAFVEGIGDALLFSSKEQAEEARSAGKGLEVVVVEVGALAFSSSPSEPAAVSDVKKPKIVLRKKIAR